MIPQSIDKRVMKYDSFRGNKQIQWDSGVQILIFKVGLPLSNSLFVVALLKQKQV